MWIFQLFQWPLKLSTASIKGLLTVVYSLCGVEFSPGPYPVPDLFPHWSGQRHRSRVIRRRRILGLSLSIKAQKPFVVKGRTELNVERGLFAVVADGDGNFSERAHVAFGIHSLRTLKCWLKMLTKKSCGCVIVIITIDRHIAVVGELSQQVRSGGDDRINGLGVIFVEWSLFDTGKKVLVVLLSFTIRRETLFSFPIGHSIDRSYLLSVFSSRNGRQTTRMKNEQISPSSFFAPNELCIILQAKSLIPSHRWFQDTVNFGYLLQPLNTVTFSGPGVQNGVL